MGNSKNGKSPKSDRPSKTGKSPKTDRLSRNDRSKNGTQSSQETTRSQKSRIITLVAAVFCAAILLTAEWLGIIEIIPVREQVSTFTMTVLELDKADCILIQNDGCNLLVDGGENDDAGTIIGFLLAQKITKLDAVIMTHPHSDHLGGLDDVLLDEDITVGTLLMPSVPEDMIPDSVAARNFYDAAVACGAERPKCKPGSVFDFGGIKLTVLGPVKSDYTELNDYSLVVRADCGDTSVLLTGDACIRSELDIIARGDLLPLLDCDILKVAHHGSTTSTSFELIEAVTPELAFITARDDSEDVGIMDRAYERLTDAGAKVYDTYHSGRLVCTYSDGAYQVTEARKK